MNHQGTIIIRDVPVSFPYEPYPIQMRYMEKVIQALQNGQNALLESPTGSGKTLCLLCATLAWRSTIQSVTTPGQAQRGPPLIVYASRTHSQLQQALRQLKMTDYKPRVSIIASRDSLCVHPKVSNQHSGTKLNQQCQQLQTARKCSFYNHLDEFETNNPRFIDEVFDIEDMVHIGQEHEICPYYLALDNAKQADFLFIPYNYLVDPALRRNLSLDVRLDNAIIIFDEAHNVESSCMESSSFDLTAEELARSILDADFCANACSQPNWIAPGNVALEPEQIVTGALLLKERLLNLESMTKKIELGSDKGFTQPGLYMQTLLARCGFEIDDPELDRLLEAMGHICAARNDNESSLRKLRECFNIVKRAVAGKTLDHYRVHIHEEVPVETKSKKGFVRTAPIEGRTISFWCFSSSVTLSDFVALRVHSLLLTSGTLSPLPALRAELGVDFPVVLENEHVIDPDQLYVGLIRKGPNGLNLNSSFKNRNRPECIAELGNLIAQFASIIPDGLLVFFPSYPALAAAMDGWKMSPVMNRIETHKRIFVEPRQSSGLNGCLTAYRDAIAEGRGAILMAVCRGKVSEGVDFSDRAARGVIVCGLPFAATHAPRIKLKRTYLDARSRKAGNEWYETQAWRAVNQAVGRVIRHRHDFGAILLCDERFCSDDGAHLSLWLRRFIHRPTGFAEASSQLNQFFGQSRRACDAGSKSGAANRANDPRFAQIRPISALYRKFLASRNQEPSTGMSDAVPRPDPDRLSLPIKVRSRDWGQGAPLAVSQTSISSRHDRLQYATSSLRDVPNLLSRQHSSSGSNAAIPSNRNALNAPIRRDSSSALNDVTTPNLRPRQTSDPKNSNPEGSLAPSQGLVIKSRESAQNFVNMLKASVAEGGWKPISASIREVSGLKRDESADSQRIHDALQRLYELIDDVPDCRKLRFHDRMKDYLPTRFRAIYQQILKNAASKEFKKLIRRRSEESYKKFLAAIQQLHSLYKEVKQRDLEHVARSRNWTDDEKDRFRRCCRDIIGLLLPLDRTWPNAFLKFIYPDLVEIYMETLQIATVEFSTMPPPVDDRSPLGGQCPGAERRLPRSPSLNRTCQFCESPAVVATCSTICRHVGCFDCWLAHLKRNKSCLCGQPASKGKLAKLQF